MVWRSVKWLQLNSSGPTFCVQRTFCWQHIKSNGIKQQLQRITGIHFTCKCTSCICCVIRWRNRRQHISIVDQNIFFRSTKVKPRLSFKDKLVIILKRVEILFSTDKHIHIDLKYQNEYVRLCSDLILAKTFLFLTPYLRNA